MTAAPTAIDDDVPLSAEVLNIVLSSDDREEPVPEDDAARIEILIAEAEDEPGEEPEDH